ncbi:MAG: SDR family oxidoreductase [Lachnospiraceae bacterium]|nr:SDR family oxidoreductase [Lachnospiraceae bacterium]
MSATILITGAGRGIGRAITLAVSEYYFKKNLTADFVLVSHSDGASLGEVASIVSIRGHRVMPFLGDISDETFLKTMLAEARSVFGSIDILINNAGIAHIGLLQDMSPAQIAHMVNVNLTAAITLSSMVIPDLLKSENAPRILNISSVWGNVGASCEAVYSATKGGINSFTRALAKELAPSLIPVNAISCGLVSTSMNAHLSAEELTALCEEIPIGRAATPEEVAGVLCHLLDTTAYLTGQIITLDGGWT